MMWKSLLTWFPGAVAALAWVTLNGLVQPWFSHAGVLLYTDAALLLVPARYLPAKAAVRGRLSRQPVWPLGKPAPAGLARARPLAAKDPSLA